jgi:DMSO/TMAO reductase YedYZ molybdopterin-dependent catalytic subunit
MKEAGLRPEGRHVLMYCYGGYTTNLSLETMLDPDVLLAHKHDGQDLTPEHGGPVRIIVPKRYAYKSAKWIGALALAAQYQPGFWEVRGYHNEADPWKEERYSF